MSEISDLTYYQENRDLILNKAKDQQQREIKRTGER